jgi:hypothetical protein
MPSPFNALVATPIRWITARLAIYAVAALLGAAAFVLGAFVNSLLG